jgi:hypothetical protein
MVGADYRDPSLLDVPGALEARKHVDPHGGHEHGYIDTGRV